MVMIQTSLTKRAMLFCNKKQWSFLRIIVKNELIALPPEPKDFVFLEAARGVMKAR